MILHITFQFAWDKAQEKGEYRADSLNNEGFIHCSTVNQVLRVANQFYKGQQNLIILVINPQKLTVPVKWENAVHPQNKQPTTIQDSEQFPHVYGAINVAAVIQVLPLRSDTQGIYRLPPPLLESIRDS
ncbi:MAG: DUF952 domain-containing protein [Microcystaceae cyanobacterium]